ncbi:MAG TPA: ABC transporter permease [Candidatus Binatia bacterium]|jgi:ABC-type polysaccharide/polyol phosphate export permease
MIQAAKELIQYRQLLFTLTWREIRIRYKETVMGFLWAILMPMMVVAAGALVRKAFAFASGKPMEYEALVSVMVKALPWAFFAGSIRTAASSLLANSNLVPKIYFPREVFPFSSVLAQLFDFAVAASLVVIVIALSGLSVGIQIFWLPMLLLLLILLTAGWGLFLSCAALFFRDVKYIVEIVMTFGILFTPVFYEASMFGEWSYLLLLNPVGSILEAINDVVVLNRTPDPFWLFYSSVWAVGSFFLAWFIFDKAEPAFAESI